MFSDTNLDNNTRRYVYTRPGERSLDGYLRGLGLKIQCSRVRDSLLRVDTCVPINPAHAYSNEGRPLIHHSRYIFH